MAEKKKTTKKTDKPAVLTGTVPEWASTTVIAQLKWPSKEDVPESADRAEMAAYACQACGGVITDQDKGKMLQAGRWQAVRQKTKQPICRGYDPFSSRTAWKISPRKPKSRRPGKSARRKKAGLARTTPGYRRP